MASPPVLSTSSSVTAEVILTALGEHADAAFDCEVNLIAYLSPVTRQQIVLSRAFSAPGWHGTPVGAGGIEFRDCLISRGGTIRLPRLEGGFLAAVSHPWSGQLDIDTEAGRVRIDLYSQVAKTVMIDVRDGRVRDMDAADIERLRSTFVDATSDESLFDQRETAGERELPAATAISAKATAIQGISSLGWIVVTATGERAEASTDELVCIVELEPIAGTFVQLSRIRLDSNWTVEQVSHFGPPQTAIVGRKGEIKLQAAPSGGIAFLCGPEAGIVDLDVFGITRRIDLYASAASLLRLEFDDPRAITDPSLDDPDAWSDIQQRRDFYALLFSSIDSTLPVALYVPRWKGVAASTKNLFRQTLPFPPTMDGHPSDVTPGDIKFFAALLLGSNVSHFVISGGDLFWIDLISRVQRENPMVRFDLLWHSNYLQMGEAHDWNLLKNWLRVVADGLVTKVAVVKSGLELLFRRLGLQTLFIPNVIRSDPASICYSGPSGDVGVWLSGSSSYRKVPYASLLALRAMPECKLVGAGFDDDSMAMVTEMRIPRGEIWRQPLPQEALHKKILDTGLTLYVTLSECSPMLPLESMHLGVPCLVGANSHLFRTSSYLYRMLVVKSPLSPVEIAAKARAVMAEGAAIIEAFSEYSYVEQKEAAHALENFLS